MEVGDYVVRKKYHKDILFQIVRVEKDIYYLKGVELRLVADATKEDLELCEVHDLSLDDFVLEKNSVIKGTVLHLDGDKDYLEMCKKKYHELGIRHYCYYVEEDKMKDCVKELLDKHKPQIVVLTGHDSLRKKGNKKNILDYQHSLHFAQAILMAREYNENKDELIIIAGACQSYYEMMLACGANFASSPCRKNIHALDPVYIASQLATQSVCYYVDVEKIINSTSHKYEGIGGIDTKGVARKIYPKKG